jgi:ferredoxin--NADP+ reductase
MAQFKPQIVLSVKHWNNTLFSFRTTRDTSFRFRNGEFVMMGLEINKKPLVRAYSIVSPNYEEYLEFLSIKVKNGALTSKLKNIKVGDTVLVSQKPTGSLIIDDLKKGENLYLLATGTGLAPFLSIIQAPEIYEKFNKIILFHGVRYKNELTYRNDIQNKLSNHPYIGKLAKEKLIYYPCVTRETFHNQGRITELFNNNKLTKSIGLPALNPKTDRAMICGNPRMLKDTSKVLESFGLQSNPKIGIQGDYVIERAFVE